jgi:hypothetical protein
MGIERQRAPPLVRSPYAVLGVAVLSLFLMVVLLVTVFHVYGELDSRITEEAENNARVLARMEQDLLSRTATAEQALLAAITDTSDETQNTIGILDTSYRSLLDAQQRRTLEALYREDSLRTNRREAQAAFAAGRYVTANRLYGEIAQAHTTDLEARFYQYYSLFLINKMDRDQYLPVREAMMLLEQQGYSRRELRETLSFIAEETGMNGEGEP